MNKSPVVPRFERVIVTGSIAYDHIMSMPGKFSDHIMPDKIHMLNVSFFMESLRKEFGGTGGNIAYSLAMLGTKTVLSGAVGDDFGPYGQHLRKVENLDVAGIKTFGKLATAQGFVMTDRDDNQIWGFYTGALRETAKVKIDKFLKRGVLLVVAPNDVAASMKYVKAAIKKGVPYMLDPAFNIPHFSVADLKLAVSGAEIVIGNDYEMELIKRRFKNSDLRIKNEQIRITTLGAKGSVIEQGGKKIKVRAAKVKKVVDPTGAGDAYRAGFVAGYVEGRTLDVCGQMGSVVAAYTVEKLGTQTRHMTKGGFTKRYGQNFGEGLRL